MKRIKRLLPGIITIAAMAVLFAICAVCAGAETYGDYEYSVLDDGTVEITRYNGNSSDLSIPEMIAGKKVTALSDYSFYGCKSIKSVAIPGSVTSIDSYAFSECAALTSVTMPDSMTSIGSYAFSECAALTSVTMPDSLTSIGSYAFSECTALTSITIPDSMTSIGSGAFNETPLLNKQTTTVKYVGKWAVCCDKDVKSAIIKSGTVGIANYTFSKCTALTSITIPNSMEYIGKAAFSDCSALTSIAIPNSVKRIDAMAFTGCSSLTSITIPDGVTGIDDYVFAYCSDLTSITIPDNVTSIGSGAFEYCTGLTSVTIPNSVTSIGDSAFNGCYRLTSVTIPYSVTSIGDNAFECTKIYCYAGTAGEAYAKENGIDYTLLTPAPNAVTGFTLGGRAYNALRLNWNKNTSADGYIIEKYDGAKWVRIAKITSNATTTYRVTGLSAGTAYKFRMKAYKMSGSTAFYSGYTATLAARTNPSNVTGLTLGGRASDALRLNWSKNTSADGYIIEKYDGSKWVRIAKITSNATTTYRVTGLSAGTAYKFRMRAYKMSGTTALYSGYTSTLAARTNPSNVTGLKIGSRASDALRLDWNKNTSADGYIIEMYRGGKWVRIKKLTSNKTISLSVGTLAKNTTYKFRVKAYKMSGTTALYSGYTTISGRTTA